MINSKWDFRSSFSSTNILIPILQRDYVQGAKETVIAPFLDNLLESDCDLNYIYGYEEAGCFVPVDGQQRLITLWLLHLYIYSLKKNPEIPFNVELKFQSREFASDFCSTLRGNLRKLLLNPCEDNDLSKEIRNQSWFISSWEKNKTVANMLNTLGHLYKKINAENIDRIYKRFFVDPCPVTFSFLEIKEKNGLDDDIYIKMNGRGRPLSVFENLKSWMDKQVEKLQISTDWESSDWKGYMDNKWTNLFWENRNHAQEHLEEIDDEQLHLFCNLLILFLLKKPSFLLKALSKTYFRNDLIEFLELGEGSFSDEEIANKILSNLSKGLLLPLVWLERLELMPSEFFDFAFKSLNILCSRYKDINNSGLYFGGEKDQTTKLYEISMTEASFGRTLPLLYSVMSFKDGSKTKLYDWLRVTRNLILNRVSQNNEKNANLFNVMTCIDTFAKEVYSKDIFDFFSEKTDTKELLEEVFSKQQVEEEEFKASSTMRPFQKEFVRLENLRFFSGRINILFKLLPEGKLNSENIHLTVDLLMQIFHGGNNGVTERFDDSNNRYLRRVLMSYEPYWYGFERKQNWSFCSGLDEWRSYIQNNKNNHQSFISFVQEFAQKKMSEDELFESIKEKVESISRNYLFDISRSDKNSFRYYFIHHPEVWNYMKTMLAVWKENPFEIFLKKNDGNNGDHMELRTYSLFLDYKKDTELKDKYGGWRLDWYGRDDSCFFFDRKINFPNNKERTIAMDILFKRVDGKERDSENCFGVQVFLRPEDDDENKQKKDQMMLYNKHEALFKGLGLVFPEQTQDDNQFRIVNSSNLSRSEVIRAINRLLSESWEKF